MSAFKSLAKQRDTATIKTLSDGVKNEQVFQLNSLTCNVFQFDIQMQRKCNI
jgi:hypothetical protein